MSLTKEDLRDFHRFADDKLDNGGAGSLVELASEWEAQRRDANKSSSKIDAHTLSTLAAAFPEADDADKLQQAFARRGGVTTAELLGNAALAAKKTGHE